MATIPPVVHQTAPHNIGSWHPIWDRCRCSWLSVCSPASGYQHILWDDEALHALVAEHAPWHLCAYTKYEREIDRVDFAICLLMYTYGGIYADMDREALSSPFPLLPPGYVCLVESPHPGSANRLQSSLLASPQGHPFWQHALREIARRTANRPANAILRSGHLDAAMKSWARQEDIFVLSFRTFNPPITEIDAFESCKVVTRHFLTGVWTHGLNRHGMRLQIAAKAGDLKEARAALNDGADPNAQDLQGLTPLHHAAIRGDVAVAGLLISNRASVNCVGGVCMTPLRFATVAVHGSSVCQLLAHGADPSMPEVEEEPSLQELLEVGAKKLNKDSRLIEHLLHEGEASAKKVWEEVVAQKGNGCRVIDKIADSQLLGSFSTASTTTPPTPKEKSQYDLSEVSVGSSSLLLSPPPSTKNAVTLVFH